MSNYLPHYTKKMSILDRDEAQLRRLIERNEPRGKVLEMAETVRCARIRVLRARRATYPPTDGAHSVRVANIDRDIDRLSETTAEEILDEFEGEAAGR